MSILPPLSSDTCTLVLLAHIQGTPGELPKRTFPCIKCRRFTPDEVKISRAPLQWLSMHRVQFNRSRWTLKWASSGRSIERYIRMETCADSIFIKKKSFLMMSSVISEWIVKHGTVIHSSFQSSNYHEIDGISWHRSQQRCAEANIDKCQISRTNI